MDFDHATNGIRLPTSYHAWGQGHRTYNDFVTAQLDRIWAAGGTAARMEEGVFELQRRLRIVVNQRMVPLRGGDVTIQTIQRIYNGIP